MKARRTVEDWRREVFRSSTITDATRVLLLLMADRMSADRKVSVPRKELARLLDRHEQRVAERTSAAVKSGLLSTVSPGYKGHTAVYQGLFPDKSQAAKRTDPEYAKGPPDRYAITGVCVPDGEYTITKAKPPVVVATQIVGSEEELTQQPSVYVRSARHEYDEDSA